MIILKHLLKKCIIILFYISQREQIAAKLAQGVSRDKIIDDVRNNVGEVNRVLLLEERDIRKFSDMKFLQFSRQVHRVTEDEIESYNCYLEN